MSATTIKLTFVLENRNYVVDGRNEDPPAQAFEEEALKRIGETYDAQVPWPSPSGGTVICTKLTGDGA